MQVGEVQRISTENTLLEATVRDIEVSSFGGKRCLLVTYDVPGYGMTQPFLVSGTQEGVYGADSSTRIARSLIPTEYINKGPKDFDWTLYEENIEPQRKIVNAFITRYDEFERRGKGLYIFSKTKGSGKTMLACIVANEVVKRKPFSVKFIGSADFIELVKGRDEADRACLDSLYQCRLLILDDIGVQDEGQAWINEAFFRLIDYRYREKRPVIYTSNRDLDNLACEDRIVDRVNAMSVPLKMPEKRVRRQQAMKETQEFLQSIL